MKNGYFRNIILGVRWGLIYSILLFLTYLLIFPYFSLYAVLALAAVSGGLVCAGVFLHLRAEHRTCSNCQTPINAISTQTKCPQCGWISGGSSHG